MTTKHLFSEFREKTGLNQRQLAEMIGVDQASMSNYERRYRNPEIAIAKRFLEVAKQHGANYSLDDVYRDVEAAA